MTKEGKLEMCLHQFIRPKEHVYVEGIGDCTKCITNEKNKYCKNYSPIAIFTYDIGNENRNRYR